jgi:hypothetical protein
VHDDFGIFLHGPLFRPALQKATEFAPPLYIAGSLTDKIWRLDDVNYDGKNVSANMKLVAWSSAPSTLYPIKPSYEGGPERLLIAEGNPFVYNTGNKTFSTWLGGVDLLDEHKCTTIFPTGFPQSMIGKVVNTVECHPSGFCFFSVWKFYDDSLPLPDPDCLYWCRVNDIDDPTSCTDSGVMTDEAGGQICHVDGKGAVHGLKIGKTDPQDANAFDMFLLFTGQATFDKGDSSVFKLKVKMTHLGKGKGSVETLQMNAWGQDLWRKSVAKPAHDVGVDHAWIDDDGKYIWVGTFRKMSDGVHMLEYETGKLIHSIFGVSDIVPGKYTYTSGLHGVGAWGKKGSVLAIATCMQFGQQFFGGTSAVVLIDISSLNIGTHSVTNLII